MTAETETETVTRGRRKTLVGVVVSVKMDKTAVVSVEQRKPHPLYRKIVRSTKRYKAHDPNNTAVLGDIVRIEETRPLSKEKRWRIAQTLTRGNVADIAPRDIGVPEGAIAIPMPPPAPERAAAATELAADVAAEAPPEAVAPESAPADSTDATELEADTAEAEAEPTSALAGSADDAEEPTAKSDEEKRT